MCLPQNSPHAPSNYTGRHSAAKTPPHCHIIHTQLCGQAGVCVMFSWRSPVAACGSLRSRKFPSELSGSLTNPHTHPPTPSRSPKRTLPSLSACPTTSPPQLLAAACPSCCFVVVVPCVSPVHCFYVLDAHVRRQQRRRRRRRLRQRVG